MTPERLNEIEQDLKNLNHGTNHIPADVQIVLTETPELIQAIRNLHAQLAEATQDAKLATKFQQLALRQRDEAKTQLAKLYLLLGQITVLLLDNKPTKALKNIVTSINHIRAAQQPAPQAANPPITADPAPPNPPPPPTQHSTE